MRPSVPCSNTAIGRLFEPHQPEQCGWKPDVLLDITDVWETKRAAMEAMEVVEDGLLFPASMPTKARDELIVTYLDEAAEEGEGEEEEEADDG